LQKYSDYTITNLDVLTYCGNLENLKDVENNPRYKFVQGNVCNQELVENLVKDHDVIVHFAAESHVDNSIKDPFIFSKTNVIGTHVLLEAARKYGIKKFVHISTDEVYGSIREGSFTESSPFDPNSLYSSAKAAADMLARSYFVTFNLPVVITRSSNNFGPFQYPEKLIPLFVTNLVEGKKVPVYGTGMNVRDWLYVVDNCEGIDFVMHNGKLGEAYNIGGGNEVPNIEITKTIIAGMGKDESCIEFVQDRPGHDWRYSLDCKKVHELGWKPRFNFQEAMQETICWYRDNENWWRKLKK
jgi:dTDP-glucose 4,6-dehydratase